MEPDMEAQKTGRFDELSRSRTLGSFILSFKRNKTRTIDVAFTGHFLEVKNRAETIRRRGCRMSRGERNLCRPVLQGFRYDAATKLAGGLNLEIQNAREGRGDVGVTHRCFIDVTRFEVRTDRSHA